MSLNYVKQNEVSCICQLRMIYIARFLYCILAVLIIRKMIFTCYRCDQKFNSEKDIIYHLKKTHYVIDNVSPIKCVVKNCSKTYNTFKGLSGHLKTFTHPVTIQVNYLLLH